MWIDVVPKGYLIIEISDYQIVARNMSYNGNMLTILVLFYFIAKNSERRHRALSTQYNCTDEQSLTLMGTIDASKKMKRANQDTKDLRDLLN